jgi:hypothetical protein
VDVSVWRDGQKGAASCRVLSEFPPPPTFNVLDLAHTVCTVQMLGSLQGYPPNGGGQQGLNQIPQQQQQQQQQPGPQPGTIPPPPPLNGQDFTLSSVLHFLQTEWRRYERDRNEWEIERAEMRVRLCTSPTHLLFTWRAGSHSTARGRAPFV